MLKSDFNQRHAVRDAIRGQGEVIELSRSRVLLFLDWRHGI